MANIISIFRVFLVFLAVFLLFIGNSVADVWALILTITAFALDGLDGWVARKFNESSKLGAVLDIMSDRIAENTFWVAFAVLGWLSIVFPIIALTRGFVVDGLRSVAMESGMTAFGDSSMQESRLGYLICCSKFSRIAYAVAKGLAFVLIIFSKIPEINIFPYGFLSGLAFFFALVAISFCVLRAVPVVLESKRLFIRQSE